jgi:putative ABC transport system ATP-binding protein
MSLITLQQLHKSYRVGKQQQTVLTGIDLQLHQGEMIGLIGPSGSGKSTLLNICGLIDHPDEGEMWWQGQPVDFSSLTKLTELRRNHIGFVFQSFNLIPVMSAADNVAYPLWLRGDSRAEIKKAVQKVLEEVEVAEFADQLPDALSGGQRQRVAIARALVKKPQLLVADEPTASLDEETALVVADLMKKLGREYGCALVIATHDDRLKPWCDCIYQLHQGVLQGGAA